MSGAAERHAIRLEELAEMDADDHEQAACRLLASADDAPMGAEHKYLLRALVHAQLAEVKAYHR